MTTKLSIFNLSTAHLAIGRAIGAVDESTAPARTLNALYDQVVAEVLREFNWPFARKFAALVVVASDPTPDWAASYRYPTDCLVVRDVFVGSRRPLTSDGRLPYIVGQDVTGRLIYTDADDAQLEYTIVVDEAFWPPDFVSAVSFLLAWYAAPALTAGDQFKLGDRAKAAYQDVVARAQLTGENEQEEELAIANLALSHLGVGRPMMTLNEQSKAARAVHQFYAQVRGEVFSEFNWSFARKFATLNLVAGPSPRATVDYAYSYRYPTDCLVVRNLRNQPLRPALREARVPFAIGRDNAGGLIFTDAAPVAASGDWPALPQLEYTVLVDESRWQADFTGAVALKLAWYVAPFVTTGDAGKLRERVRAEYDNALSDAWTRNVNEREDDTDEPECAFLTARN